MDHLRRVSPVALGFDQSKHRRWDGFLASLADAQIQPDGSVRQVCVDSAADANAVLNNTPVLEEK